MSERVLDDDTAALLAAAAGMPALSHGTAAEARANYDSAPKPAGVDIASVVDDTVLNDDGYPVPVRRYVDGDATGELAAVVFFHGGGWVLSSVDGHDALARRIARLTGAAVVSVDYRLAPEYPFPTPFDDCWAVTRWVLDHGDEWGIDPARLAVCGDSAGGNLAAAVALRARDEGLRLSCQALIYPCIDSEPEPYASMDQNAQGYFLTATDMEWFWGHYVPRRHRANPHAVPARADDLSGLAPALIQTAEFDPLRDEGERYAHRLERAGVAVTLTRYPGVVHGFVAREHQIARAADAHHELASYLRAALTGPGATPGSNT